MDLQVFRFRKNRFALLLIVPILAIAAYYTNKANQYYRAVDEHTKALNQVNQELDENSKAIVEQLDLVSSVLEGLSEVNKTAKPFFVKFSELKEAADSNQAAKEGDMYTAAYGWYEIALQEIKSAADLNGGRATNKLASSTILKAGTSIGSALLNVDEALSVGTLLLPNLCTAVDVVLGLN